MIDCVNEEKAAEIIKDRYMREIGESGADNVQIRDTVRSLRPV